MKAGISYFLNMYKTELKTELQRVNFGLTEISSIWILLEFWRYFWPQGYMSSVLSSVHVCRNVRISYLFQSKAQKWSFEWYSVLQGPKNMGFSNFQGSPQHYRNSGSSVLSSEVAKMLSSWTSEKNENFTYIHHLCSKCTSFEIQWFDMKWY